MPPHPTLFDDDDRGNNPRGDDRNTTGATADRSSAHEMPAAGEANGTGRPNYLARRAIVVGAVVVAVALGAIGIGRLIGGGGSGDTDGAANAEWNRIVLFDARRGVFTLLHDNGEEAATHPSGIRNSDAYGVVASVAVVADDDTTAIVDLGSGDTTEYEFGSTAITAPAGTNAVLLAAAVDSSRGLLVHGSTADVIDTAEYAAVAGATYDFARAVSTPSGRHVLVTDTGNFQSVLFSFDRDEPSYFPGLALAIDDDTVVTAQNVGGQATISVFDHDGEPTSAGRTDTVRAAMLSADTIVLVTVDGSVVKMSLDSGETEEGIPLGVGTIASGTVMLTGDRLVVVGADGTRLIDDDGNAIGAYAGLTPFSDTAALRGATCIVLTGPVDGSGVTVVDARSGDAGERIDVEATTVSRSADGCTVAVGTADGTDLITADGRIGSFDGDLVALAPDATHVIVDIDATLLLAPTPDADNDDTDSEPVELGAVGPAVTFVDV